MIHLETPTEAILECTQLWGGEAWLSLFYWNRVTSIGPNETRFHYKDKILDVRGDARFFTARIETFKKTDAAREFARMFL